MSTAALALVAAVTALSVVVLATTLLFRSRRASDRRVARALQGMRERMDALADELGQTVEKVREDAQRTRLVESLGQALDLDEVITRSAEAAASLPGVAGAVVRIEVDGVPLVASAGFATDRRATPSRGWSAAHQTAARSARSAFRTTLRRGMKSRRR